MLQAGKCQGAQAEPLLSITHHDRLLLFSGSSFAVTDGIALLHATSYHLKAPRNSHFALRSALDDKATIFIRGVGNRDTAISESLIQCLLFF